MAKYRKKPVVIEAEVYRLGLEDGFDHFCDWYDISLFDSCGKCRNFPKCRGCYHRTVPYINTLEGKHYISPGDYIITGVKGEKYPCKPDIFHMTYEEVENEI